MNPHPRIHRSGINESVEKVEVENQFQEDIVTDEFQEGNIGDEFSVDKFERADRKSVV